MSHNNRNFVLAYAVLVILPLFGLAGILKAGRHLKAPFSIDGAWALRVDRSQLAALPCGKSLSAIDGNSILISQSGETFAVSFADGPKVQASSGIIEGSSIHASITPAPDWASDPDCGSRKLSLSASIDSSTQQKSLSGKLSVDDCPSCTPVDFYALRQAAPVPKGAH